MKLFGSAKKIKRQIKELRNCTEYSSGSSSLVENQYQQESEVLYNFMPNKYYAYLWNVEPSNLVFFWKPIILSLVILS